jgi:hypothetical protein
MNIAVHWLVGSPCFKTCAHSLRRLASAALQMTYSPFWDCTQCRLGVSNRRFGTTYRSRLQGPGSPRLGPLFRKYITLSPDSPQSFVVSLISLDRASSQKRCSLCKIRYILIRRCWVQISSKASKYPHRFFAVFPTFSCRYSTVKIGHDRFLPRF